MSSAGGARMIPTLLLIGFVLGALSHDRRSFIRCATGVVAVAIAWGLGVGLSAGSLSTVVGGFGLAVANLAAAGAISGSVRAATRRVHANRSTPLL